MLVTISLEAPASPLLEQLIKDSRLPHLAALQQEGEVLDLIPPFLDGSVYATLYTGQHLSEHGIYSLFTWSAPEQRLRLSYDLISPDTLFRKLDQAGKRVLAIDPPEHPLQELTNGVVVSGCQFRSRVHLAKWSRPRSVGEDLSKLLGMTPRGEETFGQPSERHLLHLRKVLIEAPGRLALAVEQLLDMKSTDVLWVHMAAIHLAGHQLWEPSSVDLIGRSSAGGNLLRESLVDVYLAADTALGRIIRSLPDNADIMVFWPKGMGPETCRSDLLAEMLKRILDPGSSANRSSGGDTLTRLRAIVPTSLRTKVADALPDWLSLQVTARLATIGKDWGKVRAFSLPSDGPGLIRLNIRGRERDGVVPESQAQALSDEIAEGLRTFSDIDGRECISSIERPGDYLPPGSKLDWLPDLVIRWSHLQAINLRGVTSPVYGTVLREGAGSGRSGNHIPAAHAIIVPRSGTYRPIKGGRPHLVDLSATVCEAAGVPHDDLPGQSLLTF
jgi:predicted AlkP superfamily phosphohydrolase/phosphomutase